jgi:NADPH:quinone reductase-like Zn-dependent oxidoreductase
MRAVYAARTDPDDPLAGLEIGDQPEPEPPPGWTVVDVRAAALNHHDLWSLRGVGLPAERLPMILGCDAAGIDAEGNDVIVHSVIGSPERGGDETFDANRTLLSELHQGTLAERVAVPRHNLVAKPASLSFDEAACLPTAWLTAYRMLFTNAQVQPGDVVLVQGAGGGVATAAIPLARAAGLTVWATSRDEDKRRRAESLGAHQSFEPGARLPARVDAVIETVGEATWAHSLRVTRPGGTIVVAGATSGDSPPADLRRLFFRQLRIVGSAMGSREELTKLVRLLEATGVRPEIDRVLPFERAREGFAALAEGSVFGKIVLTPRAARPSPRGGG